MTWALDTLNLDLTGADEITNAIADVAPTAPTVAALMQAMIAFNHAVEDSPVTPYGSVLFAEVRHLNLAEVAVFVALISDTAQQADEILDNAALGDYWLFHQHGLLHDAKSGIEQYGEALQQIVNHFNPDDD